MRRRALISMMAGGIAVVPPGAPAQTQGRTYRLAILTQIEPVDPATGKPHRLWAAFFDELRRLGYDEGRNLAVTWHSSEGDSQHVASLAHHAVALKPDVIYCPDARMLNALRAATTTTPIVAATIDPVGAGVAASLARPGGNITGFTVDTGPEIFGKRLELLKEAVPAASRVAWLTPRRVYQLTMTGHVREAFRLAGLTPIEVVLDTPVDEAAYRRAFAVMAQQAADSFWLGTALEHLAHRRPLAELAIAAKLPGIFAYRENVEAGGLMSYGNDPADNSRRSAEYIDRILKGARPAEMPFQQPARFELVVNLRTARVLGLTLSPAILARADEVIE